MALVMVRRNQLGDSNRQHSFFMISTEDLKGKSLPAESIKDAIRNNAVEVVNLYIQNNTLCAKDDNIGEYPLVRFDNIQDIVDNKCGRGRKNKQNINRFVIVGVYEEDGERYFAVSNYRGELDVLTELEVSSLYVPRFTWFANATIDAGKVNEPSSKFGAISKDIPIVAKRVAEHKQYLIKAGKLKQKIEISEEESRKITEAEESKRKNAASFINENKAIKEMNKEVRVGDKTYTVDDDTVRQLQAARDKRMALRESRNKSLLDTTSTSIGDDVDTTTNIARAVDGGKITFEEKLIMAATTLKYIDPFLYAAYMTLDKVLLDKPEGKLRTMGVTDDKIFLVVPEVNKLELPVISWILLHEMSHIIMMHPMRGRNKHHYVYNIACDLFINKNIAETYGCRPGVDVTNTIYRDVAPVGLKFHSGFTSDQGYVCACYDESIDCSKMTVEMIYNKLMTENQNKLGGGSGKSKQSGGNPTGMGSNPSNDPSNDQGGGSPWGDGGGASGTGERGEYDPKQDAITFNGNPVASLPDDSNESVDLFQDKDSLEHGDTDEQREAWGKDFIRKVSQRANDIMRAQGLGTSPMMRVAEQSVQKDFVWTQFVKRFLTKLSEDGYSYKKPNRKMMNHGLVMKGRVPYEAGAEEDVFVCIDVSGSVNDESLYRSFQYIITLLKKLTLTGSVVYWSTAVDGPYEFKNAGDLVDLRKKGYKSTGGTDPNCLFKWFADNRKRHKPKLVIVITDGCFAGPAKELKPKDCETLWIITEGDYRKFKMPFGKVAPLVPKK